MAGEWTPYAKRRPDREGVFKWRIPSVAIPGMVVIVAAHMRERGAGYVNAVSPAFDYWDGYQLHVPAGTEWMESDGLIVQRYEVLAIEIEGLSLASCIYCGKVPSISHFGRSNPHESKEWRFDCCRWGTTPVRTDPREIEAVRRKAFSAASGDLLPAIRNARDVLAAALKSSAPDLFVTEEDVLSHKTIAEIDCAIAKATGEAK